MILVYGLVFAALSITAIFVSLFVINLQTKQYVDSYTTYNDRNELVYAELYVSAYPTNHPRFTVNYKFNKHQTCNKMAYAKIKLEIERDIDQYTLHDAQIISYKL